MTKSEKIIYIISVISFILTLVGGFIIASGYKYIGLIISIPSATILSIFLSMLMGEKGL